MYTCKCTDYPDVSECVELENAYIIKYATFLEEFADDQDCFKKALETSQEIVIQVLGENSYASLKEGKECLNYKFLKRLAFLKAKKGTYLMMMNSSFSCSFLQ
jgi:hypothetical protein